MRVEANGVPTRGAMTTTQEPSAAAAEGCRLRTGSRSTASDPERAESVSQMARQAPPTLRSSTERSEGWVSRESNSAAPTDLSAGQSSRMTQTNVEPLEARYALTLTNRNSTRVTSASGLAAEGKSHTKYDGKDVTFDIQAEVATVSRVGPRLRRQNAVKVDVKRESEKLTSGSVRSAVNVKARKARAGGPLPAPVDGKAAAGGPCPRLGVPGAAEARSDENLDVEHEPEKIELMVAISNSRGEEHGGHRGEATRRFARSSYGYRGIYTPTRPHSPCCCRVINIIIIIISIRHRPILSDQRRQHPI